MNESPDELEIGEIRAALWPGDDYRLAWGAEFLEGLARALPDDACVSGLLGGFYTDLGRYEEALAADERTVELDPGNAVAWYNLGCSQSLLERGEEAYASIARAIELGFADAEAMERDSDLDYLRKEPRFAKLMRAVRESAAAQGRPDDSDGLPF